MFTQLQRIIQTGLQRIGFQLGLLLMASLFIVTGIKGLLFDLSNFTNVISSKDIPFPKIAAIVILTFKIISGIGLIQKNKLAIQSLIIFMIVATALYHNFISDPSQITRAFSNIAIIGGLLILLVCSESSENSKNSENNY